jgi:NAD(P)-dependent dehydrogenase (short-subunit alcohol dehydrogenase family)
MQSLHQEHPDWKPVRLRAAADRVDYNRQLFGTVQRLRRTTSDIDYLTCDVADYDQVERTIRLIEQTKGPIRGVVHAAGLVGPTVLSKRDLADCCDLVAVKADGLYNLTNAVDLDQLDFFCTFTSLAGHFGMDGQFDYSAASALASALTSELAWRRPGLAAVAIDWTAWDDTGMALTHADRQNQEIVRGLRYVSAAEGCDHMVRELLAGDHEPQVMVFGSLGVNEPTASLKCLKQPDFSLLGPVVHGSVTDRRVYPLVDNQLVPAAGQSSGAESGEVVFARRLDPRIDRFLIDHLVKGLPTLPGFFHIEAMAEAAALTTGWESLAVESASFLRFVKCRLGQTVDLVIRARPVGDGLQITVSADVTDPKGNVLVRNQDRSAAFFRPGPAAPPADPELAAAVLRSDRRAIFDLDAFYRATQEHIAFGPSFRLVEQAWRLDDGRLAGLVRVPRSSRPALSRGGVQLLTEPLLIDSAARLALIELLDRSGDHVVPVELWDARFYGHPEPGSLVIGLVDGAQPDSDPTTATVDVMTLDGRPLIHLGTLRVRATGHDLDRPLILAGVRSQS